MVNKEQLEKLYWDEKLSLRDITKKLGYKSSTTIRYYFKKFNINTRNHREASMGKLNGMYGKKISKESREKMSISHKNNPVRYWLGKKGKYHVAWKGGLSLYKNKKGYIIENYTLKDGVRATTSQSHRVWREANGWIPIPDGWVIHHLNRIRDDNRIENLIPMPWGTHAQLHSVIRENIKRQTTEG